MSKKDSDNGINTAQGGIQNLIAFQDSITEQLDKFWSNYKKTPKERFSVGYIKGRLSALESLWEKYEATDRQIHTIVKESDKQGLNYFKEDQYSKQEDLVSEWKGLLLDALDKYLAAKSPETREHLNNSSSEAKQSNSVDNTFNVKLPQIEIPRFDGDYREWLSFHDLFQSLIHTHQSLPAVQKLHYLKSSLGGEALNLIRHLSMTDNNYEVAWNLLCDRYKNPRLLVNCQIQALLSLPCVLSENPNQIRRLVDTTNECLASLKSLEVSVKEWDPIIVSLIVHRLPNDTRQLWEQKLGSSIEFPSYEMLSEFLDGRVRALEVIGDSTNPKRHSTSKRELKKKIPESKALTRAFHSSSSSTCPHCTACHTLKNCPQFKTLDTSARFEVVKNNRLCFNCLASSHDRRQCPNTQGCFKCGKRHNTMLHFERNTRTTQSIPSVPVPATSQATSSAEIQTYFASKPRLALLATALVCLRSSLGEEETFRALVDPGSQASFITTKAAQKLRLKQSPTIVQVQGLGQTQVTNSNFSTQVLMTSLINRNFSLEFTAIVLRTLTGMIPATKIEPNDWPHIEGLTLADPHFYVPGSIDLVLGADIYAQVVQSPVKIGNPNSPVAQKTHLGWILFGQVPKGKCEESLHHLAATSVVSLHSRCELDDQLRRFWEIEEGNETPPLSSDELLCESIYQQSHYRNSEGRYVVKLPFAPVLKEEPKFGESREIALKRFQYLERKFRKDPCLHEAYTNCIEEYITLGHAERVAPPKGNVPPETYCYLPHHAVLNTDSVTTKLRVVFDASCKTSNGFSLNDRLLVGPPLHKDISTLLVEWRLKQFVFCADIEKMYRQIRVSEEDADFQRIVWRRNPESPIEDYRLRTVTFGTASAPFLAIRTLRQLAEDEKLTHPQAANTLLNDVYVDDVYAGADTVEGALILQRELISLLKLGKFDLRKWSANSFELLANVPTHSTVFASPFVNLRTDDVVKTLGLFWNPINDEFRFRIKIDPPRPPFTKRSILSYIARLYDPLGWLTPVIIKAKLLIQSLWLHGVDWDEALPTEVTNRWKQFIEFLPAIEALNIPRWIRNYSASKIQIHGFCDASERAYAASVYIRVENENSVKVFLLAAKSKVAPLKPVTLPRLELCGALLLSKLLKAVIQPLRINCDDLYAWSDSTIVLSWLRKPPNSFKVFVSNRISEILRNIGAIQWRHVPSQENPADCGSRGISGREILTHPLWLEGPPWLKGPENSWPQRKFHEHGDPVTLEMRPIRSCLVYGESPFLSSLLTKYSRFNHLLRVTSYLFRFSNRCRKLYEYSVNNGRHLSSKEIHRSKMFWVAFVQRLHFKKDIDALCETNSLPENSKLSSLNPFTDNEGILRVGGRLAHAELSYNERHPIIIPNSGHFTDLLVQYAHVSTLHGGPQAMLTFLRQEYWVLKARNLVKRCFHKCVTCFRWGKKTQQQLMANLPSQRVTVSRPFTFVGIDYTGYINLKMSRGRGARTYKGYIVIFVCLCVKAIHLEVVGDLTTAAFLAAFRRFISRRGLCRKVFSDNGTNFVGAKFKMDRDLKLALQRAEKDASQTFNTQGIDWEFIPPASPHFGGLWEAGVKSLKYHLKRIVGNSSFVYEELVTLTTQIEACLNSRPLCPLSDNVDDLGILTPGHFLVGSSFYALPEEDYSNYNTHALDRWHHIQKVRQDFWSRWSTEYLSRLQQRPKWCKRHINVKVGEIVLIKDERLPPLKWMLGRITKTHPGNDGLVRVVTLRTSSSEIQRPITKICRLPSSDPIDTNLSVNTLN